MHREETIRTTDGTTITARIYEPEKKANKVTVIASSAEVTQEHYYDIAVFLTAHDFAVVTFDYRGTGVSGPQNLKGFNANLENWAQQDLDAVLRYTKSVFPKQELIFIGHGIGGEIVGLAAGSQFISRMVFVSSALSCTRLRRVREKIWIVAMKKIVRFTSWIYGYFPGKGFGLFNNLPKGVMDEWMHWCDNENGLFDDFPDYNYRKLQVPILVFSFSDDWRSQANGVAALLKHFTAASVQWYHIKPKQLSVRKIGHSGFFKASFKTNLWPLLLTWTDTMKSETAVPCFTLKSLDKKTL
jgi:predicted alpha/beta hydrolase